MGESIDQSLARIGDEAEEGELDQTERPLPPGVKASQPNRGQSRSGIREAEAAKDSA